MGTYQDFLQRHSYKYTVREPFIIFRKPSQTGSFIHILFWFMACSFALFGFLFLDELSIALLFGIASLSFIILSLFLIFTDYQERIIVDTDQRELVLENKNLFKRIQEKKSFDEISCIKIESEENKLKADPFTNGTREYIDRIILHFKDQSCKELFTFSESEKHFLKNTNEVVIGLKSLIAN